MAFSLFSLLDDIALLVDDAAVATKVATKKASAILIDDMAVNANKAAGFSTDRELPVIYKIAMWSFVNKLIIVPLILALSFFAPFLIAPILIVGALYLSYEGAEKILEWIGHKKHEVKEVLNEVQKIKSAVITDFVLSVEIVVIALNSVKESPFVTQAISVSLVAVLAVVFVYGLVALIVRMDDMGLKLIDSSNSSQSLTARIKYKLGYGLVQGMPYVVRSLMIIGTVAMLLVGGELLIHNIHYIHEFFNLVKGSFVVDILFAMTVGLLSGIMVHVVLVVLSKIKGVFS